MKTIKFISYLAALSPIACVTFSGILMINILGWMAGKPGGLSGAEFMGLLKFIVILAIFTIVWFGLIGLLVKKSPIKCYKIIYNKMMMSSFASFMDQGEED